MTHFGVLCPPVPGHLNPMTSLGRELQRRGHRVTFLAILDVEAKVLSEGLNFYPIGQSNAPLGSSSQTLAQLGKLSGLAAVRFTSQLIQSQAAIVCHEVPDAIQAIGIEALLVDQFEPSGGSVAESLNLPFITICNALALNQEAGVPPPFYAWNYSTAWWAGLRNQLGFYIVNRIFAPTIKYLAEYRRQHQLPVHRKFDDCFSSLAQISQQPAEFDFPRTALPKCFHYTGTFLDVGRAPVAFPFEQLTGQPLIYASMGTLQNRLQEIFHCIAAACAESEAQLVISLGGGNSIEQIQDLPGSPLVVEYAPQLELLALAKLTITHAGLNTVLESLSYGVPMVAIPITNDQPGVGARLTWTGAGEVVSLNTLSIPKLRDAVERVLTEDAYSNFATRLKESFTSSGVIQAADIVEMAVRTRCPVLRTRNVAASS